ncbi:MAG: hypothetical protein HKO59_08310 [Phycisphaerales bacterium]|nr:hypothetical protein [Phycisphaerales bacterium]NNM25973.1 hypothetical protein [Phycisphaerales bacterium]
MPYTIVEYEPTPNPNAVKCWLDHPVSDHPRSFLDADSATGDPLAAALFEIEGVRNLLFNGSWITVNKHAEVTWPAVKKAVERVLAEARDLPGVGPVDAADAAVEPPASAG